MIDDFIKNQIADYGRKIKDASLESVKRATFQNLLTALFLRDGDVRAKAIIDQFTAGTEHRIENIIRGGKKSDKGSADTQYGNVLIEFENDLARTGPHAVEQLKEYLSGNWNSDMQARFTLIATDCLEWRIYSPDYDSLIRLGENGLKAEDINLELISTFRLEPGKEEDFYYFLDKYLFKSQIAPATLLGIRVAFGSQSDIFQSSIYQLHAAYEKIKDREDIKTAYEQWHKFLSIAYGSFEASEKIFIIQSYLSILAKMLSYEVITGDEFLDDNEMREILDGTAFRRSNIANFTSDDFFRWTTFPDNWPAVKQVLRNIASELGQFDFTNVTEDILKGVYQELIDDDTKHKLGEYYTPDWLCSKIIEELNPQAGQKLLDPSCGSGSFLKATANHLIKYNPNISASELNNCLYGIDVHPLSVQIAKATLLIAYGRERLKAEPNPITLNIYLANTLLLPEESASLFGDYYTINIDDRKVDLPIEIFKDMPLFHEIVGLCEKISDKNMRENTQREIKQLRAMISNSLDIDKKNSRIINGACDLYKVLLKVKKSGRDSIWSYILSNSYIALFLKQSFDYIAGNPPWITFRDLASGDYQDKVKKIAEKNAVMPDKSILKTQLELAAVFLAHTLNYFLKPIGKLAFVLPRNFFNAGQHHNTRIGKIRGMQVTELWDLADRANPFKIPSCVLFAKQPQAKNDKINCKIFSLSDKNTLSIRKDTAYLSTLGNITSWTIGGRINYSGQNPYYSEFMNGATIFPRSICFVDIDQEYAGNLKNRKLQIKSCADIYRDAKEPWRQIFLSGEIHSDFLFETALAGNIVPFSLNGTFIVALPCVVKNGRLKLLFPEEIATSGYIDSADWFSKVFKSWDGKKTKKSAIMTWLDRLNYHNGIVYQKMTRKYIVAYTISGSNAVSAVITRNSDTSLPFVAENKTCVFFTNNKNEAFYLSTFLNSTLVNEIITPFQNTGLMGPRDIGKRLLEVFFPKFDKNNKVHLALSKFAIDAAAKVKQYLNDCNLGPHGGNLSANESGRLRNKVREHIKDELANIDEIIKSVLKAKD